MKTIKPKNQDFPPNFRNKEAETDFFTPKARLAFTQLKQAFVKAPIFHHFDLECYIQIQTNILGYTISGILSQLVFKTRPDGIVIKTNLG